MRKKVLTLQRIIPNGGNVRRLFKWDFIRRFGLELEELTTARNGYLQRRMSLIKMLVREGSGKGDSNINTGVMRENNYALDSAILQCKDSLLLQRGDDDLILNNLYLLTGRFQEAYDLSCYFIRKGTIRLNDPDLHPIRNDCMTHRNMKKSYFKEDAVGGSKFVVNFDQCHWTAICQMYLTLYMLHMEIEKLLMINSNFLDNQDCILLIGEFVGIKKELFVKDKNRYRDQAFEVVRFMHCEDWYFDNNGGIKESFQKIKEFASECFPPGQRRLINHVIEIGVQEMKTHSVALRQDGMVTAEKRSAMIKIYEDDHDFIHRINIQPALAQAVEIINKAVGHNIFGVGVGKRLGVTEFVAEVMKACKIPGECKGVDFTELIECLEGKSYDCDMKEIQGDYDFPNDECFTKAIFACLLIEQKLAQCHFNQNKWTGTVKAILDQLPGGSEAYSADPPSEPQEGPFHKWEFEGSRDAEYITNVCEELPDVTKVIDSLVEADLDSNDRLGTLFGRSGFAACRIWCLREKKDAVRDEHYSIQSYIISRRPWKEGCTDKDMELGLKIKYLNKDDRKQHFEQSKKEIPMGKLICYLQPSIGQFAKRFGTANSGFDSSQYLSDLTEKSQHGSITKKRRCELDGFLTLEEACRHYFDCKTLEEAIWDLVGIPRVVVLDHCEHLYRRRSLVGKSHEGKLKQAGWKYCGLKAVLGDKSVQLGRRVAYVYTRTACTIWEEQGEIEAETDDSSDSSNGMETW